MVHSLVDPPRGVPYMLNIQISMGKSTGRSITSSYIKFYIKCCINLNGLCHDFTLKWIFSSNSSHNDRRWPMHFAGPF